MRSVPDTRPLLHNVAAALVCDRASCPCRRTAQRGEGLTHCPAHDDQTPSLSITARNGRVLWRCHTGCTQDAVTAALRERGLLGGPEPQPPHPTASLPRHPTAPTAPAGALDWWASYCGLPPEALAGLPLEADGDGSIGFRFEGLAVRKIRRVNSKEFAWRPSGGTVPPLWPMPAPELPETIWLLEGESDATIARQGLGLPAYAATKGAGSALTPEQAAQLRRQGVERAVILFDVDIAGREGARRWAECLAGAGIEPVVVDLAAAGLVNPLRGEKDLRDAWLAGRDREGLLEALERAAQGAPMAAPDSATLRFVSATEALQAAPETVSWLWDGYLAEASITLVAGAPKAGKSTLLCALLAALSSGEDFLGRRTQRARAVVLTKERTPSFAAKLRQWRLGDDVSVLFRHSAFQTPWPDVVRQAVRHAKAIGAKVLAVDTLAEWAQIADENSATEVLAALQPLQAAAAAGLGVVLLHRQRKSPGGFGQAVRGSSALTGGVDVIVELERPPHAIALPQTVRVLRGLGRFEGTPAELVAVLGPDGYELYAGSLPAAEAETGVTKGNTPNARARARKEKHHEP